MKAEQIKRLIDEAKETENKMREQGNYEMEMFFKGRLDALAEIYIMLKDEEEEQK